MHKYIKHLILLTISLVGLSSLGLIGCAENHKSYNINITIDGKPVNFTGDLGYPYLTKTARTMVPIRIISENMGYNVNWSKDTWDKGVRKVWINNNTTKIELEIGKSTAIVNGKVVPIDRDEKTGKPVETKAELIGARTYVPLRFITEAMGGKVEYQWKDGNHYITITTGKDTGKPSDEVSFVEPEIIVNHTKKSNVSTYFVFRLNNVEDYKDTGINISTELTNYPEFVKYRVPNIDGPGYFTVNNNEYYSNWDYERISGDMGRFYELQRMTIARKLDKDEKVTLPPEGFILKYKVTVTVGNETKVYNIDVPFHHKQFDLDNY